MTAYNKNQWEHDRENGRIPLRELAEIGPPEGRDEDLDGQPRLHPEAAWNYERMRDTAGTDGVVLRISYSYRTLKVQQDKWDVYVGEDNMARTADDGTLAATVGNSNHGWGTAVDLNIDRRSSADPQPVLGDSTTRFNWLKSNAHRYGFDNEDAPSEPWHWTYRGDHPIEEAEMTPEERAEFDEMKKTIKMHERFISALLEGLGSEQEPARFEGGGKRVAKSVRQTEE